MKPVFHYDDYRQFLQEHYEEKKKTSKSYSFRYFARKAGLNSPNYYKLVMDGQRNLTQRNVRKFAKGLGLGEREAAFFENLVFYNQAADEDTKCFFRRNLQLLRNQDDRTLLTRDQYAVLAQWFPLAIKEVLLMEGFTPTPKAIASRFDHRFTPQQARDALDLLARLGLIEWNGDPASIRVTKQSMQTPDLAQSDAAAQFHKAMAQLALESVDGQSSGERCLSALTVAVRKQDLPEAFKRLHQFRNEMDAFFAERKPYDAVYQLNLQLFRLDDDV